MLVWDFQSTVLIRVIFFSLSGFQIKNNNNKNIFLSTLVISWLEHRVMAQSVAFPLIYLFIYTFQWLLYVFALSAYHLLTILEKFGVCSEKRLFCPSWNVCLNIRQFVLMLQKEAQTIPAILFSVLALSQSSSHRIWGHSCHNTLKTVEQHEVLLLWQNGTSKIWFVLWSKHHSRCPGNFYSLLVRISAEVRESVWGRQKWSTEGVLKIRLK